MGMYDHVELPEDIDLPGFPDDEDPSEHTWQTKDFHCVMTTYRITEDGRLEEELWHSEEVPKEERPFPDADPEEEPFKALMGSVNRVNDGWEEKDFHGVMNFCTIIYEEAPEDYDPLEDERENEFYDYEAKFTDGELEEIRRVSRE